MSSDDRTISENIDNLDPDCQIVKFVPSSKALDGQSNSVFLRTLRSGKVLFSSDQKNTNSHRVSRSVDSCSTTRNYVNRKIVAHKARIVRSPTTSKSQKSETAEVDEDMDSPKDIDMVVDEMPDDMLLSAFINRKRSRVEVEKIGN
ncbi:hypothetical protein ZOSMA_20G00020 [Zostera marina]|uniref:Uncharacterized protein n=1 Tax=Zostera marina TaxID=29655 RepID=A0A0K9PKN0_ZOSMR|nr:hypothetical protein ZOSMA_20G00020 [Zostera marina]